MIILLTSLMNTHPFLNIITRNLSVTTVLKYTMILVSLNGLQKQKTFLSTQQVILVA